MSGENNVPLNERMAVVEAQVASMISAVIEIKDAVVGIRSTLQEVARLDERLVNVAEAQRELRRALEAERDNRIRADHAMDERIKLLENTVPLNSWRHDSASSWTLRIGGGAVLLAVGWFLNAFIGA